MIAFGGARDRSDKHTNGWKKEQLRFLCAITFFVMK